MIWNHPEHPPSCSKFKFDSTRSIFPETQSSCSNSLKTAERAFNFIQIQSSYSDCSRSIKQARSVAQAEEGEQPENQEERLLRQTDSNVGRIHEAAPEDTLLIVASCHGDTASTRLAHVSCLAGRV